MHRTFCFWTLCMLLTAACAQFPSKIKSGSPGLDRPAAADPAKGEVLLETAADDWTASLILDNQGVGVWTVMALPVFPQYACDEVIGLDDDGRCWVMVSYSGKWTPHPVLQDGAWLGGLAQGDVDPRVPGGELYTGGKNGILYQVLSHPDGHLDGRRIASFSGQEIHTVLAGELSSSNGGRELLIFTHPGAMYRVSADLNAADPSGFAVEKIADLNGRIRDAIALEGTGEQSPGMITASRNGQIRMLRLEESGPHWTTIHELKMGRGRLSLAPSQQDGALLFYSTADDGRVYRHQQTPQGWMNELIYAGPQGPRGLAAGNFSAIPGIETVAVFGYSGRIELLSRTQSEKEWKVQTLFKDLDKGHWLGVGELDGRNGTHELIASGYGGRIVMLARPAGYGMPAGPAVRGE